MNIDYAASFQDLIRCVLIRALMISFGASESHKDPFSRNSVVQRNITSNEVNLNAPLPFVEGVGPSCQWLPAGPWKTVIDFFKEQYPHVHATTWKARMEKGQVRDETGR